MGDASLSESPEEEDDNDSPGPGNWSPKNTPLSPSMDNWFGSPRKRTQTLPTFNCPLTGTAAKADAVTRSRIQESVEENSGTLSEDIFKILDLRGSGSFFGGSQISTKECKDRLTARRGSDSATGSQKPNSDSQPALRPSQEKSTSSRTVSGSVQQVNSRTDEKKDSQQLVDR